MDSFSKLYRLQSLSYLDYFIFTHANFICMFLFVFLCTLDAKLVQVNKKIFLPNKTQQTHFKTNLIVSKIIFKSKLHPFSPANNVNTPQLLRCFVLSIIGFFPKVEPCVSLLVQYVFCKSACWQLQQAAGDGGLRDSCRTEEHPGWLMQHLLLLGCKKHMHQHAPQRHGGCRLWDLISGCSGLLLNSARGSYFLAPTGSAAM